MAACTTHASPDNAALCVEFGALGVAHVLCLPRELQAKLAHNVCVLSAVATEVRSLDVRVAVQPTTSERHYMVQRSKQSVWMFGGLGYLLLAQMTNQVLLI